MFRFLVALPVAMMVTGAANAEKIKVEKADDLPRYEYKIDGLATDYLTDTKKVLELATSAKKDLLADLETYEIADATTLQGYYGALATIALIDGDYDLFRKYRKLNDDLEDKEAVRLTAGLFTRAYVAAVESGADLIEPVIRENLAAAVKDLPYDVVEARIKSAKGMAEVISEHILIGSLESTVQPLLEKSGGILGKDRAIGLIGAYFSNTYFIPHRSVVAQVYSEYLEANAVEKEDIWAGRNVSLEGKEGNPVTLAIWDSGVDADCFPGKMWVNSNETAGNGKDDDGNGFVDDIHGIAFTLFADKTAEPLIPTEDLTEDPAKLQTLMKGFTDITSAIDSDEASEVKKIMSTLKGEEVKEFIENMSLYGGYCHGTHVGGIAAAGNPHARLLAARMTFDHRMIGEIPTVEQSRKDSIMMEETVAYFRANGVRAVNMSWGGSLGSVEADLEQHNIGETPEERKALAREIFEIQAGGLERAMGNAPEILFITSAGNSDNDVEFDEIMPSGFKLPNLLTVGAVDQAGDETSFTSTGKVEIYASGFEVNSFVPGGDEMKLSGTSQASPNVTNLVGKMLAIEPELTVSEIKSLLLDHAEPRMAGDREVRLLNPKKSMAALMEKRVGAR